MYDAILTLSSVLPTASKVPREKTILRYVTGLRNGSVVIRLAGSDAHFRDSDVIGWFGCRWGGVTGAWLLGLCGQGLEQRRAPL